MAICNYIYANMISPIQSLPVKFRYYLKKNYIELKNQGREHHIVVSLTSFPVRFPTLHYVLKSILNQTMAPDLIFLCLAKSEVKDECEVPLSILELKKYGLEIYFADDNLKPHNKYLYAMELYPNSLIITIDDDNIYDVDLVSDLYNAYLKYPNTISARRVHRITQDRGKNLLPYKKWHYEYSKETKPSFELLATGVGGVLYPPGILPSETFDKQKIMELCLNADDIWLKFMQLKNNIPVHWVKGKRIHPFTIKKAQKISLNEKNYHKNMNDKYISGLQDYYNICLTSYIGKD